MVLCQYYLNGNCRFGTKCDNEHFDVKQIIKSEVEAALKGSQWPLSCFGPFKEKPSLQNFITDQSFEEVRFLCYEAKKQQNFPAYSQQFTQQIMDGQNKMKTLLSLSRDVVAIVVNLYNTSCAAEAALAQQGQQQPTSNNPFAMGGSSFATVSSANNNSKSLFGNTPAQSNPFASSAFGGTTQTVASSAGIFGGAQAQPVATNAANVFGGQNTFGGTNNAFGTPKPSVFGGGGAVQQQPATNAFSLPQLGGGHQPNQTANAFGMAVQAPAFGTTAAANAFGVQSPTQTNIFGQQSNLMQSNGIFAQQSQQQQQQQAQQFSGFAQPAQANAFGSPPSASNVFGQTAGNVGPNFGMADPQVQQQNTFAQPGPFQKQQVQFGGQPPNVFGTAHQPQQQNNAMQPGGVFGGTAPNAFQQNANQQFGGGVAVAQLQDSAYSKMEDLTPEVLEAFKAPNFVLGKLPTVPPPRELCG